MVELIYLTFNKKEFLTILHGYNDGSINACMLMLPIIQWKCLSSGKFFRKVENIDVYNT